MRHLQKAILVTSLLAATSAMAADKSPFSTNVALTSNYVWRGVSQTAENMAIQGGIDYAHVGGAKGHEGPSGFYLGAWGSNVNFGNDAVTSANGDGASMELDLYGGYKFKAGPLDLDVGFINYRYPGAASSLKYDFTEIYVGAGYGPFTAKFYNASNYQGVTSQSGTYLDLGAEFDLKVAKLTLHVGKSGGDGVQFAFGKKYTDYKVGLSKEFGGFTFGVAYTDTNMSGAQQIKKGVSANDGMVILTVSKSL
ncbi:MAG: TorF family putative porin [Pseudomonadota bacterium]